MTTLEMQHAFISFSSKDEKQARALCDDMEQRGIPCWISSRDVRPGRNYQTEIIEAIRSATHLLLVFSTHSGRSEEVARELSLASRHHVRICPVRIEDVQPIGGMEFMLATSQWVDAFRNWKDAMDRLGKEIGGAQPTPPPPPPTPKTWRDRLPLLAGVAVVLAMIGAGSYYWLNTLHPAGPKYTASANTSPTVAAAPPAAPAPPDPTTILANVEALAGTFDCAAVSVTPAGPVTLALSGFVKSGADEQRLLAAARPLHVQNDIDVAPWPFCAVRKLGPSLGASDDIAIDINHPDGRYAIGDDFSGSIVVNGAGSLWVQLDLIDLDGTVTPLLPPRGQVRQIRGGERIAFGAAKGQPGELIAGEPTGPEVLLVFASDKPLPPPGQPDESASAYLPKLHDMLAKLGANLSISARSLLVVRQ